VAKIANESANFLAADQIVIARRRGAACDYARCVLMTQMAAA
jgi:hypothetical protein